MDWYYNPEDFGLETIGEIEWSQEAYQFDLTAIWWNPAVGRFVMASDSGCSCPSPFEDFRNLSPNEPSTQFHFATFHELKPLLEAMRGDREGERLDMAIANLLSRCHEKWLLERISDDDIARVERKLRLDMIKSSVDPGF